MAKPKLNRALVAKVVALATQVGNKAAAVHFGISTKSVERYLKLSGSDAELSSVVEAKKAELEAAAEGWAQEACDFMVRGIKKLGQLVDKAEVGQMRDVTGAIKIVGELDITRKVLGGGEYPRADRQGPAAEEAPDGAGSDQGDPPPAAAAGVH